MHISDELELLLGMLVRVAVRTSRLAGQGLQRTVESLWRVMRREGWTAQMEKKKPYKPKPYEQMQYPGQRVQIDVKVVPRRCIADP